MLGIFQYFTSNVNAYYNKLQAYCELWLTMANTELVPWSKSQCPNRLPFLIIIIQVVAELVPT